MGSAALRGAFAIRGAERPAHEDYGHHSGLGLSICKQIIDAHRGRIYAENIVNDKGDIAGASFHVILRQILQDIESLKS